MTLATLTMIFLTMTGGAVSGRVTSIAVDPSDPSGNTVYRGSDPSADQRRDSSGNTIYVGSANGGVWKTTNF